MRVKIVNDTVAAGKPVKAGAVLDLALGEARLLISYGQAVEVKPGEAAQEAPPQPAKVEIGKTDAKAPAAPQAPDGAAPGNADDDLEPPTGKSGKARAGK